MLRPRGSLFLLSSWRSQWTESGEPRSAVTQPGTDRVSSLLLAKWLQELQEGAGVLPSYQGDGSWGGGPRRQWGSSDFCAIFIHNCNTYLPPFCVWLRTHMPYVTYMCTHGPILSLPVGLTPFPQTQTPRHFCCQSTNCMALFRVS